MFVYFNVAFEMILRRSMKTLVFLKYFGVTLVLLVAYYELMVREEFRVFHLVLHATWLWTMFIHASGLKDENTSSMNNQTSV